MRGPILFACLSLAVPLGARTPAPAGAESTPRQATRSPGGIEVLWAAGSPVTLGAPRLATEDGLPFVECQLTNNGEADAWEVEALFLVYDGSGRRKAAHQLALAGGDLPVAAHGTMTVRLPLPYGDLQPDETVRMGLTKVRAEGVGGGWSNDNLGQESDAQMEALFAPPRLVVSNPEDAPVAIRDVSVRADTDGHVIGIALTAATATQASVRGFTIAAHLVDVEGRIHRSFYQTVAPGRALLPDLPYAMQLRVSGADVPHLAVWVGLESTKTPDWKSQPDTREQARVAMQRRRR
jgi:hypothetical protein